MRPKLPPCAELVIPALALGFAVYFFFSIADLAWEAKANGVLIGAVLSILVLVQLARLGFHGRQAEPVLLWGGREAGRRRLGLIAITVAFIATLQWLGLTLGLFLALLAALWVMGVRKPALLIAIPAGVALSALLLFIVLLQSDFPHGPIERLVQ